MTQTDLTTLDTTVQRYLELDQKIKDLQAQQADIKAALRDLGIGKYPTSVGVTVTITPNRRFNTDTAAKVLGAISSQLLEACSVTKVDSAATKRMVGDEIYQSCMAEVGDPVVRIV